MRKNQLTKSFINQPNFLRMKTRKFIVLAAVAAMFVACSKDNGGGSGPKGSDIFTGEGDAWMAISIDNSGGAIGRNLNNPNIINGTAPESKITTARAIFFDANRKVTQDIQLTAAQIGTPGQTGVTPSVEGEAFKVSSTSKHILLVANPHSNFPAHPITVGETYDNVNKAMAADAEDVAQDNNFMMSNAKGDLEPSNPTTGALQDLTLYKTAIAARQNALELRLDRVVVKVRVFNEADMDPANAVLSDFGWVTSVKNKTFYPASLRQVTWNENTANTGALGFRSPFDQYKIGSYRKDPNYTGQSASSAATDYITYTESNKPSSWNASGKTEYCLENTQDKTDNMNAYTTNALITYKYSPKGLSQFGTTTKVDVTPGADWLSIGATYYTYATLMPYIQENLRVKYLDADPDNFSAPILDLFLDYLKNKVGQTITLPTKAEFLADYDAAGGGNNNGIVDPAEAVTGAAALMTAHFGTALQTAVETHGADTDGKVSYYKESVSYYIVMIKHDDTDKVVNEFGEFGVVRNSVYDIRISAVNNPGSPIIPTPNPDTPDEHDDMYLSLKISINPWTWYTQGVEL